MTWVRPELVIRAELGGWSRDGIVRQAAYKGIEPGRDPTTVVRETAVATTSAVRAAEQESPEIPKPATKAPMATSADRAPTGAPADIPDDWRVTDAELEALAALGKEGRLAGRAPTS